MRNSSQSAPLTSGASSWIDDERHGPLPILLLVLTMVTGLVDAVSYLKLGHVFVANMTGNVVFLGFAVGGAKDFSETASLVAIAAFLGGALGGGALGARVGAHRGRLFAVATYIMIALVAAALLLAMAVADSESNFARYALIVLLALSMGLQNATARRLGVPDLTTTVLTLTLTGIAADSALAGGRAPNPARRLLATVTMFVGAAVGALLVFRVGTGSALALVLALLCVNGVLGYRFSSSSASWTAAT
jgi:uncharacterized membrane protein YoaK (UPF0700 family)